MIKSEINKPLSFHYTNLFSNGIDWDKNKIKYHLSNQRNISSPSDKIIFKNPYAFKINLEGPENSNDNQTAPFCFSQQSFDFHTDIKTTKISKVNISTKSVSKISPLSNLLIFTTIFHINILAESSQVFIDAIFRASSKSFYQLLIIHCHSYLSNTILPSIHIFMSNKSYMAYYMCFFTIKEIFKQNQKIKNRHLCTVILRKHYFKAFEMFSPDCEI